MDMMVEWPGRCSFCANTIDDWSDSGLFAGRWVHKQCFQKARMEAGTAGEEAVLRAPTDRSAQLELPMLIFLLLFHFGLGGAVIGWILITQGSAASGAIVLAIGIVTPLIGVAGVAVNIISRRRIELIRRELDARGGWRPGR